MSQSFLLLINFYILTKLFYYFYEYHFVLLQNYKTKRFSVLQRGQLDDFILFINCHKFYVCGFLL